MLGPSSGLWRRVAEVLRGFVTAPCCLVQLHRRHPCRRIVRHAADMASILTTLLSCALQVRHDPRHLD
jgi:hypothetical protein